MSNGFGAVDEMNSGAKLELSCSPLASTKRPIEKMPPAAFSTPSTERTRSRKLSAKGGGLALSAWPVVLEETATSVPL